MIIGVQLCSPDTGSLLQQHFFYFVVCIISQLCSKRWVCNVPVEFGIGTTCCYELHVGSIPSPMMWAEVFIHWVDHWLRTFDWLDISSYIIGSYLSFQKKLEVQDKCDAIVWLLMFNWIIFLWVTWWILQNKYYWALAEPHIGLTAQPRHKSVLILPFMSLANEFITIFVWDVREKGNQKD